MHRAADRLAATQHVQRAIRAKDGGDSWHLFLDKLSFERDGAEGDAGEAARTRALQDVCAIYQKQRPGALARACAARLRWLDALARQLGPGRLRRIPLVSDSRLLLHLGRASVLENVGLYCDRTTGLPLIPGTALKGVLSTWACWEDNEPGLAEDPPRLDPHRRELARRILGDNSRDGSEHAGEVIFLGAFPAEPPVLGLDIVNPHHDADTGKPKSRLTPNAFLALEPGATWHFAFHVRASTSDAAAILDTATTWLRDCLTQLGLGARTAAGYGRFRHPGDAPRPVVPPERPKTPAELEAELIAIIKNSFNWDNKLKEHVAAAHAAGDRDSLEKVRALAAQHLDKNKLGQLRLKPWFPK